MRETINIFSSSSELYAQYVPTLIQSIYENVKTCHVRFFLLHLSIRSKVLKRLKALCDLLEIEFVPVRISQGKAANYRHLKDMTTSYGENNYALEGMFMTLPNQDLPDDVDRALALGSGDVMLCGDISEFYFSDFGGNLLTVSKGFASDWAYAPEDLYDRPKYIQMASEYFNTGAILFNVAMMRRYGIDFPYYYTVLKHLKNIHQTFDSSAFFAGAHFVAIYDQGLLGAAYAGHINFYDPDNRGNFITPYNFRPFVLESNRKPDNEAALNGLTLAGIQARIIHLLGNKPGMPLEQRKTLLNISQESLTLWDHYTEQAAEIMEKLK